MPNLFSLIGSAWGFYQKQPILNHVLFWLYVIPLTLSFVLNGNPQAESTPLQSVLTAELGLLPAAAYTFMIIINIALALWILWGHACVLTIGQRIIKSPAGRSRSSFATVRKQGSKLIVPLFLTDILRDCITVLMVLPALIVVFLYLQFFKTSVPLIVVAALVIALIIPAILYRVRTIFYDLIIACEKVEYRASLNRSRDLVHDHTGWVLLYTIGMVVTLFLLPVLALQGVQAITLELDLFLTVVVHTIIAAGVALAMILYVLTQLHLFAEVKQW